VKTALSTLLLISICSLPVGVAYSADAPDADVKLRMAAISAPPVTALPKTPTRAVAGGDLDLRPPDLRTLPLMESLLPAATIPAESDELQAAAVVTAGVPLDETSNTDLSLVGIGSLYWAAHHPTEAWRVLTPIEAGDEFDAPTWTLELSAPSSLTPPAVE
jgi:hypothetical protein